MDGRKHPDDPTPTWFGHSIGRWDGDTLVIDTIGYNDKFWFDRRGHPHTERLHTVERWTRTNFTTLVNRVTIDDPGAYTRPFTVTFTANLGRSDSEILEYICIETQYGLPSGRATRIWRSTSVVGSRKQRIIGRGTRDQRLHAERERRRERREP